jgi:acyl-CoA reductase-like NAD-dependent aldehyde dehydrogenase
MTAKKTKPLAAWIGGRPSEDAAGPVIELVSPVDGGPAGVIAKTGEAGVSAAVENARQAFQENRRATAAARSGWLHAAATEVEGVQDEMVESMIRCIGKPRRAAAFEAGRTAQFIHACANEALSVAGEVLPLDAVPAGAGRFGFARRVPFGVIGAVSPFNAPANLLMQKVAPALAVGNAVVCKPAQTGTVVALILAQAFKRAGLPDGLFNVVPGDRVAALALVAHPVVAAVSITSGTAAGEAFARAAGAKRLIAELGSNAANIVCADANLDDAAKRIAGSAFEASGQQCISAQRVIVEQVVLDDFLERFVGAARDLNVGDPYDQNTDVGPMVNAAAANRVEAMVLDAVEKGGRLALAPTRDGCVLGPAIIVGPAEGARLLTEEAFGPVVIVMPVADLEEALSIANDTPFGLQGACFTASLETAFRVSEEFDVGSLWINEGSRFRLDMYPFGGVGASGYGREGVRYAMEELSQWKFTGIRLGSS